MAVVNVQSNGIAPAGLSTGDFVQTAGGMYQIVAPGTPGANYNPQSGYWSTKSGLSVPEQIQEYYGLMSEQARQNTAKSQEMAREQMNFQTEANAKAMNFSAEQAELNRQWQERLSSTAHQREVLDLVRAGLNPVLSANSGASTPSGASASGFSGSGAQGSVDTSVNSVVGGLLDALISQATTTEVANINRRTALETTLMNNEASKVIAKLGADASILGSSMMSAASRYGSDLTLEGLRKYTKYGMLGDLVDNLLTSPTSSARGTALVGEELNEAASRLLDALKNDHFLTGTGRGSLSSLLHPKEIYGVAKDLTNIITHGRGK